MTVQIMPDHVSAHLKRTLGRKDEAQAEILEWIGTAYGRRREAKAEHASAVQPPATTRDRTAWAPQHVDLRRLYSAASGHLTKNIRLIVLLLAGATAAATIVRFQETVPDVTSASSTDLAPHAADAASKPAVQLAARDQITPAGVPAAVSAPAVPPPMSSAVTNERPALPELDAAAREASDNKAREASNIKAREASDIKGQLSRERDARVEAEAQAARLVTEAASLKLAREQAETTLASMGSELETARKARQDAEAAARAASDALSRKEQQVALAAAPSAPPPKPDAPAATRTRELPPRLNLARLNKASTSSAAGNAAFLAGRKLLERGDLPAARLQFEKAVKAGLPEAALALGNTYDPFNLSRAGSARTGDPDLARQWYRRAYALALRQQQR